MNRITVAIRVALATLLLLLSPIVQADPPAGWEFLSFDEALEVAARDQRPVFLYFGRHGCPSCERTNRESFTDQRVIDAFNARYVLAYVDSESGSRLRLPWGERITEMELGIKLKVYGTPFFYFMEPDGQAIMRAPGYQSAEEFLLYDRFVSGGHYREQSLAQFKEAGG